ncbi:Potassium channel [Blyttiomyces sp. JEL0837]|nr:Potassium channel [Blyttiomyces sp. JEL0837]
MKASRYAAAVAATTARLDDEKIKDWAESRTSKDGKTDNNNNNNNSSSSNNLNHADSTLDVMKSTDPPDPGSTGGQQSVRPHWGLVTFLAIFISLTLTIQHVIIMDYTPTNKLPLQAGSFPHILFLISIPCSCLALFSIFIRVFWWPRRRKAYAKQVAAFAAAESIAKVERHRQSSLTRSQSQSSTPRDVKSHELSPGTTSPRSHSHSQSPPLPLPPPPSVSIMASSPSALNNNASIHPPFPPLPLFRSTTLTSESSFQSRHPTRSEHVVHVGNSHSGGGGGNNSPRSFQFPSLRVRFRTPTLSPRPGFINTSHAHQHQQQHNLLHQVSDMSLPAAIDPSAHTYQNHSHFRSLTHSRSAPQMSLSPTSSGSSDDKDADAEALREIMRQEENNLSQLEEDDLEDLDDEVLDDYDDDDDDDDDDHSQSGDDHNGRGRRRRRRQLRRMQSRRRLTGSGSDSDVDAVEESEIVTEAAVRAAQEMSPLWHRQHMTLLEAKEAWRALWGLLAATIFGLVMGSIFNIVAVIHVARETDTSFSVLGEGATRAVLAAAISVAATIFVALDTASFLRARILIRQKAAQKATISLQDPRARIHKGPPLDLLEGEDKLLAVSTTLLIILINVVSLIFSKIEGWTFRESEQWYVASITCVGFALRHTQTQTGKGLLLLLDSIGIIMIGVNLAVTSNIMIASLRRSLLRGIRQARALAAEQKRRRRLRRELRAAEAAAAMAEMEAAAAAAAAAVAEIASQHGDGNQTGDEDETSKNASFTWHAGVGVGVSKAFGRWKGSVDAGLAGNKFFFDRRGSVGGSVKSGMSGSSNGGIGGTHAMVASPSHTIGSGDELSLTSRVHSDSALGNLFGIHVKGASKALAASASGGNNAVTASATSPKSSSGGIATSPTVAKTPSGDSKCVPLQSIPPYTFPPAPAQKESSVRAPAALTNEEEHGHTHGNTKSGEPGGSWDPRLQKSSDAAPVRSEKRRLSNPIHSVKQQQQMKSHGHGHSHAHTIHPHPHPPLQSSHTFPTITTPTSSLQHLKIGIDLRRTQTVDSTTEAALELGYGRDLDDDEGTTLDKKAAKELLKQYKEARAAVEEEVTKKSPMLAYKRKMRTPPTTFLKVMGGDGGGGSGDGMAPKSPGALSLGRRVGNLIGQSSGNTASGSRAQPGDSVGLGIRLTPTTFMQQPGGGFRPTLSPIISPHQDGTSADDSGDGAHKWNLFLDRQRSVQSTSAHHPPLPISGHENQSSGADGEYGSGAMAESFLTADSPEMLSQVDISDPHHPYHRFYRKPRSTGFRRMLGWLQDLAESHADTIAAAVLVIFVWLGGAVVLTFTEPWNYLDAVYFSYSLMTTTGYGDLYPDSSWGRTLQAVRVGKQAKRIRAIRKLMQHKLRRDRNAKAAAAAAAARGTAASGDVGSSTESVTKSGSGDGLGGGEFGYALDRRDSESTQNGSNAGGGGNSGSIKRGFSLMKKTFSVDSGPNPKTSIMTLFGVVTGNGANAGGSGSVDALSQNLRPASVTSAPAVSVDSTGQGRPLTSQGDVVAAEVLVGSHVTLSPISGGDVGSPSPLQPSLRNVQVPEISTRNLGDGDGDHEADVEDDEDFGIVITPRSPRHAGRSN